MENLDDTTLTVILTLIEFGVLVFTASAILFSGIVRILDRFPMVDEGETKIRSFATVITVSGMVFIGLGLVSLLVFLYGQFFLDTSLPTGPFIGISNEARMIVVLFLLSAGTLFSCVALPIYLGWSYIHKSLYDIERSDLEFDNEQYEE